ncbi:probable glutathione S-transferase 5 [Aplysia californica]|uniref:Probable glutathione S-transferase 5 n=1 Tax=Aplysia californica TaxID=6500 RepID=A0ABM1VXV2_APLCA|nr:probable glutathione S-transferase 5 [Aplysia californica]
MRMATHPYTFLYFDAMGRGEFIRLVFAAAEVPFEDIRFTHQQWPKYKKRNKIKLYLNKLNSCCYLVYMIYFYDTAVAPFGQVPYLEAAGKRYGQSVAIATYLAREFGKLVLSIVQL